MAEILEDNQFFTELDQNEDTTKDLYLTFEVDHKDYAIDVAKIKEIITMCTITSVPKTPDYVKGIINLRGDIIPIIDIRTRFSIPEEETNKLTCIIVLDLDEYIIGLTVDYVKGVFTITEENISAPPNSNLIHENQFIKNIGKVENNVMLILDIDKLLF